VTPNIEPGYLQHLIPEEPPEKPENWNDVMADVEKKIMIGVEKPVALAR
jgi:aromatic-L-amino-acid decarboxylase